MAIDYMNFWQTIVLTMLFHGFKQKRKRLKRNQSPLKYLVIRTSITVLFSYKTRKQMGYS